MLQEMPTITTKLGNLNNPAKKRWSGRKADYICVFVHQ